MARVRIYIKPTCPYCRKALALLARKGVTPEVFDVSDDAALRSEMIAASGGRTTVPQIWIGETHIGGCDDLHAAEAAGTLDPLLQA